MIILSSDYLRCHVHPFFLQLCILEVCELVAGVKHYMRSKNGGQNIGRKQKALRREGGCKRTHCDPVYLRHFSKCIVPIEHLPCNPQGGMDGTVKPGIACVSDEMLINVIHGWDHGGKVRCALRKKNVTSLRFCDWLSCPLLFEEKFKNVQVVSQIVVLLLL